MVRNHPQKLDLDCRRKVLVKLKSIQEFQIVETVPIESSVEDYVDDWINCLDWVVLPKKIFDFFGDIFQTNQNFLWNLLVLRSFHNHEQNFDHLPCLFFDLCLTLFYDFRRVGMENVGQTDEDFFLYFFIPWFFNNFQKRVDALLKVLFISQKFRWIVISQHGETA